MDGNPLLAFDQRIPFDAIEAKHVEPAINALLEAATTQLERLAEPGPRTYENTLGALEALTEGLENSYGVVTHLESVLGDDALRAAYNAVQPAVSAFYSKLPLNAGLWEAVKAFAETEEAAGLEPTRRRFLDKTVDDFKRHGATLGAEDKGRLEALEVELADLTNRFGQSVVDSTDAWSLDLKDEARLAGLPEGARKAAKQAAERAEVEGWRFTLHGPSYLAVMVHMDDRSVREQVYRAYNTRGVRAKWDNRVRLARILELRSAKATLLGYSDVSDLHLEPRMVKTGAAAEAFVARLRGRTEVSFREEHAALQAFQTEFDGEHRELQPWDLSWYAEKQRKALYDFDAEALRPYFAAPQVLSGLFEIVQRLYGVTVTRLSDRPIWHADVEVYGLDDEDGRRIGVFYADLFPRAGKRGGAWMRPLLSGDRAEGTPQVGLMAANVTPAVGDAPALLTHREVETLFHEFGHLLHHLLSEVTVRSLGGTNVAWDFVELPSQIMENWCWAREALDLFARHHETGEAIPEALYTRMQAARTFRGGNAQMRQLCFATVDLKMHRDYDAAKDGPILDYARGVMAELSPAPLPDDYAMVASFTHLFASPTGYAAGYYSYKWAEVLDADAFTRFEAEGVFSREVGQQFRERILAQGDSRDPAELYEWFMGRGPDPEALMRRVGLV